ncbi:hypothetical protein [Rhodopirellula bahusiensis]|uniref:hypothetical protein n=1 Tax=Rhodopirellula bahusiensis TaxID=2014065 RepID=UPI003266213E
MFRRLFSRLFCARPSADRDVLTRVLTAAGMIELSQGGYALAELSEDVSSYMEQPIDIETVRRDLEQLESVGVVREEDGVWLWDCVGIERNQTVVSRLSSHLVG